jgi:hypothetical protein
MCERIGGGYAINIDSVLSATIRKPPVDPAQLGVLR